MNRAKRRTPPPEEPTVLAAGCHLTDFGIRGHWRDDHAPGHKDQGSAEQVRILRARHELAHIEADSPQAFFYAHAHMEG